MLHLSPDGVFLVKALLIAIATAVTAVAHQIFLRSRPLSRPEWRSYQQKNEWYKYRKAPRYQEMIRRKLSGRYIQDRDR